MAIKKTAPKMASTRKAAAKNYTKTFTLKGGITDQEANFLKDMAKPHEWLFASSAQLDRIEGMLTDLTKQVGLDSHNSIMSHLQVQMGFRKRMCEEHKEIISRLASLSQPTEEQAEPQPEGLQPGDYTDASKETADALTAMGWGWWDEHRHYYNSIGFAERKMTNLYKAVVYGTKRIDTAEFLRRAAVTAKELGLVPVEPWVPKVGEWVVVLDTHTNDDAHGTLVNISGTLKDYAYWSGGGGSFKSIRPATEQEIAAHLAEQEAKKPVEFGTRVECRGKTYRIIADNPDTLGFYPMYCNDARAVFHAKRSEFTIID